MPYPHLAANFEGWCRLRDGAVPPLYHLEVMMFEPGKYRVFGEFGELHEGECFVLRSRDALAVMTLRSYAANALQLLDWNLDPGTGLPLTEVQREHLHSLADEANARADLWTLNGQKVPD